MLLRKGLSISLPVLLVSLLILVASNSFMMPKAGAQAGAQAGTAGSCSRSILGLPTWFRYLELGPDCEVVGPRIDPETERPVDYPNGEFDWQRAAGYVAVAVVEILLRVGSLVAVAFVMYGGFRFITSQGDPEGAKNARTTIINALIGLVITIASASIVSFIANRLTS